MKELKPCPFCGLEAEIKRDGVWFVVGCKDFIFCGCQTPGWRTKEQAIEAWNKRVGEEE